MVVAFVFSLSLSPSSLSSLSLSLFLHFLVCLTSYHLQRRNEFQISTAAFMDESSYVTRPELCIGPSANGVRLYRLVVQLRLQHLPRTKTLPREKKKRAFSEKDIKVAVGDLKSFVLELFFLLVYFSFT